MKKRIVALMMSALLAFPLAACTPKTPSGPSGETGERSTLLFEIDEGMCGMEFVSGCKFADGSYDYDRMDLVMNNIYDGIKDLAPKYQPAVHIYFNWYYDARGWGGEDPSDPINRWDPSLLYAMDFFREKKIPVYFEWMSSGNYTNQNGELGTLPLVDIYLGTEGKEARAVKGISADIAAVKALHEAYPDIFLGVRFHELIGTHNGGASGDPHCYTIEQEDVYALIDACADMGIRLIWSDHSWSMMYNASYSYWQDRVKYAEEKLGDDLIIMWANNAGGYLVSYLNYSLYPDLKRDFPTARLGFSAQNWLLSAYYLLGGNQEPKTGPGECDTPVELTAGVTLSAIDAGASFVQYEPSYQFFNWPRSLYVYDRLGQGGNQPGNGYKMSGYTAPKSQIEGDDCDYSARAELKRLVEILNSGSKQFANVADFYDADMGRIQSRSLQDPPKTYSQVTVAAATADGNRYFDHYNNDDSVWLEQNNNRFTDRVYNDSVIASGRVLCNDHAYDEVVTVVKEGGKNVGYFYNARSCLLSRSDDLFADNEKGEFVAFTAANLLKSTVSSVNMDCDELVVARKKDGKINLSLYQAVSQTVDSVDRSGNFVYREVVSTVDSYIVESLLGSKQLEADGFMGLVGIRDSISVGKTSRKRNIDGLFAVYGTEDGIELRGKKNKTADFATIAIALGGKASAVASGDWDLDLLMKDELIVASVQGGKTVVEGYKFVSDNKVAKLEKTLDLGTEEVKNLAVFRKAFFVFDPALD